MRSWRSAGLRSVATGAAGVLVCHPTPRRPHDRPLPRARFCRPSRAGRARSTDQGGPASARGAAEPALPRLREASWQRHEQPVSAYFDPDVLQVDRALKKRKPRRCRQRLLRWLRRRRPHRLSRSRGRGLEKGGFPRGAAEVGSDAQAGADFDARGDSLGGALASARPDGRHADRPVPWVHGWDCAPKRGQPSGGWVGADRAGREMAWNRAGRGENGLRRCGRRNCKEGAGARTLPRGS